ncbi:hypothetical protein FKM82_005170 [Ascaphus truei]
MACGFMVHKKHKPCSVNNTAVTRDGHTRVSAAGSSLLQQWLPITEKLATLTNYIQCLYVID